MSEPRDDYLWDPQAAPDDDVAALERALSPLRHDGRPLDAARLQRPRAPRARPWWWLGAAAAAALVVAWLCWPSGDALEPGAEKRRYLAADVQRVKLGDLAEVELEPGSEVWFLHWRADEARFQLRAGGIKVRVAPPPAVLPRFFCVDTPRGSVVDLGCSYVLRLRPDGSEYVHVTDGAVEFAYARRRVFVPAGAECTVMDGWPATPLFTDAVADLRKAVHEFDEVARLGLAEERRRGAKMIADHCRGGRDTLPLWHLLFDGDAGIRTMAEELLVDLEGPPPGAKGGVTKDDPLVHADPEEWLVYLRRGAWTRQ